MTLFSCCNITLNVHREVPIKPAVRQVTTNPNGQQKHARFVLQGSTAKHKVKIEQLMMIEDVAQNSLGEKKQLSGLNKPFFLCISSLHLFNFMCVFFHVSLPPRRTSTYQMPNGLVLSARYQICKPVLVCRGYLWKSDRVAQSIRLLAL